MIDLSGRPDDLDAEIKKHLLDQHGYEGFVFNKENPTSWMTAHVCPKRIVC